MRYRPEIDGLRAVAVLPVILFHANIGIMPGGFIGVDVFFVISGYLITGIITEDLANGRFSIIRFYERRIRRIAPAMLLVCLACIPFAAMWMLPPEFKGFGKSLFHSLLMVSNFELWDDVSYFAPKNELKPLLHTWSLSVEEQFYLVFPPLLWALRKRSKLTMSLVVGAMALLSFGLTFPFSRFDPVGNFYLPFTRLWELAGGALLAIYGIEKFSLSNRVKSWLALLGLAAIISCSFLVTSTESYPGPITLIPCIATLLVIAFASSDNLAGRLLGFRPLVGIGLISYSLYLWHQPVFAFARLRSIGDIPSFGYIPLIALTFSLAIGSYFLIEKPFRKRTWIEARAVVAFSGVMAGILIAIGITIAATNGFPGRDPELAALREPSIGIDDACDGQIIPRCATTPAPVMAVWGDSFAMHLVDGIVASMPADGAGLVQLNMSSCGFMSGVAIAATDMPKLWPLDCLRHNEEVKSYLSSTHSLRYVVLGSQFRNYLRDYALMTGDGQIIKADYQRVLAEILKTLNWLRAQGLKPVVFAPPPRIGRDIGLCLSRTRLFKISNEMCRLPREEQRTFDELVTKVMTDVSRQFPVVSLEKYLCNDTSCSVMDEQVPVYFDDGHLSRRGSIWLGQKLTFFDAFVTAAEVGWDSGTSEPRGICQLSPGAVLSLKQ
ncbi:acyltransferase family protein [Pararhizobium sp. PWRC1-1]|uniref:acyltransferase family protein n=1 Tax=Pararhizobium sp. PWRC1-1 TaxID=2804566 RepID=UPI003CF2B196